MKTILSLMQESARKANLIASGENLSADQVQETLDSLNSMLDSWTLTVRSGYFPTYMSITDTLSLPDGYTSALMLNLAVQICMDNELSVSAMLQQQATFAMSAIRRDSAAPLKTKGDMTLKRMSEPRRRGFRC